MFFIKELKILKRSVLVFEWNVYGGRDIIESFERLGYTVKKVETDAIMDRENVSFDIFLIISLKKVMIMYLALIIIQLYQIIVKDIM